MIAFVLVGRVRIHRSFFQKSFSQTKVWGPIKGRYIWLKKKPLKVTINTAKYMCKFDKKYVLTFSMTYFEG